MAGATTYYARVTATYGGSTVVTPVSAFTTLEVIPPVPVYVFPGEGDTVLYSMDAVRFEPAEGASSLRVQISASESFPARTTYNGTLEQGTFETIQLGDIKGSGKLTDGKTYYVRARYAFNKLATGTTVQYTDYCAVRSFVYHEVSVGDVNEDGEVGIADVNKVIDIILNANVTGNRLADVNGDGEINIADINALINLILN